MDARAAAFPAGASITLADLEGDPHPHLARLRREEPVSWLPALGGWLVTRRDLALEAMRDAETFTVDDPRFSTGQVVGRSMLTTDGAEHRRHRDPFARPFRLDAVRERFTGLVRDRTDGLIDQFEKAGRVEIRSQLAGPLATLAVAHSLGLDGTDPQEVLRIYRSIVDAVTRVTAGEPVSAAGRAAFAELREQLEPVLDREPGSSLLAAAASEAGGLSPEEVISNAGVLMFGGIETTEGMITNAVLHVLEHADALAALREDPSLVANALEESLRFEPSAAVIDRYATRDVDFGGAPIRERELVTISIAGANRDPQTFAGPDRFDVRRANASRHLSFAGGPHVCVGMHLARLEGITALERLLTRLPALRLDPERPAEPRGLVFRKPPELHVLFG